MSTPSQIRPPAVGIGGYFESRWRGTADVRVVFWRDLLLIGSLVNMVATFAALMMSAMDAPIALALAVHLSPIPFNLFLFSAIWRAKPRPYLMIAVATVWLGVMTVL